jgi:sulfoxide reductase heme-binding subunit YedZ
MRRRARIALKTVVWGVCLAPLGALAWWFLADDLTANPIDFITDTLGIWAFRFLLASLALTPLRILTGKAWPITLRRLLGLFAFAYAALHFTVWIAVDHFFDWPVMVADVAKRPYVTVGMLALLGLLPLAATSTAGMVKRLGAVAWRRLHRLVYLVGVLVFLHFLWLAKVGRNEPWVYGAILALLLGIRGWDAARTWVRRRAAREGAVGPAAPPRGAPFSGRI